jgi:hypothetical protein
VSVIVNKGQTTPIRIKQTISNTQQQPIAPNRKKTAPKDAGLGCCKKNKQQQSKSLDTLFSFFLWFEK